MSRTIALIGKQGPAFGTRPSHTELSYVTFEDSAHWMRVSNWPRAERADALRAVFDSASETIDRDGDFAGYAAR